MTTNIKEYYQQITGLNIGDIAQELLGDRVTQESPNRLMCDCPNHQSESRLSLHIMVDKQGWYCFGCGKGGDILQLVEFIQSGQVTSGKSGLMPDSHRKARDFLATKAGLPPLSNYGMTKEGLARAESAHAFEMRVKEAMTGLAKLYNSRLKEHPEVMEWLKSKYAINDETIDNLLIGYADNEPATVRPLMESDNTFSKRELAATGAFQPTSQDDLFPFFERRLVFPYWSQGQVVFLIGRKTPWTPDERWEKGKYRKSQVHNKHIKKHIAPFVNNSVLYNEDILFTRPERIIITEGVTDCIALMQQDLPVISPVTVRIRANDWQRLIPKLRGVETVYICQDNEISGAGLSGALQSAEMLAGHDIDTRLIILPLGKVQETARAELEKKFKITASIDAKELSKLREALSEEDQQRVSELLSQAKIDVNDYFATGHNGDDFKELMSQAMTPVEFSINNLDQDCADNELDKLLSPLLLTISKCSPLEQERLLKLLQFRLGKNRVTMTTLKKQLKQVGQQLKEDLNANQWEDGVRDKWQTDSPLGSCRACVNGVLMQTEIENGSPDYIKAAEAAYDWFTTNGAIFFRTCDGKPIICFNNAIYWMDSGDRGTKRAYSAMIFTQTGMVPIAHGDRTFFEVLASLATERGQEKDHFSWIHTDITKHTIWFNLNNEDHQIVKITPDGVEVIVNGNNTDQVILGSSSKIKPIKYHSDVDPGKADELANKLIVNNLSCPQGDRLMIMAWVSCFLLIDFAGTRPMTRFEGTSGSGKTTASKLITTLIYGSPQHKIATLAANYTDGAKNPLLALDNIEVKQMTDELTEFMLTSITGVAREKRRGGTDSDNVSEHVKCLLNTTGIEPLRGDLSEILSRTFTINFETDLQANNCFLEVETTAEIGQQRDIFLSAIMKRTSQVLAMIRDRKRDRVLAAIQRDLGPHDKRRCNDYLSLMYLMMISGAPEEEKEEFFDKLHPDFISQVKNLNQLSRETAKGANPIAAALHSLFNAHSNAVELDIRAEINTDDRATHVSNFIERFHFSKFTDDNMIIDASANELCTTFGIVARQVGIDCHYRNASQLGKRLNNDKEILKEAGFDITVREKRGRARVYDVTRTE